MKSKKTLALLTAATLSLGAAFSLAQQTQNSQQSPTYKGSIPLQGTQNYAALAKVSMADAVKAAQTAVGSATAPTKVQLSDENGYLVWEVVIAGQEVKIDAGNAQVLDKATVGGAEENDGEGQGEDRGEGGGEEESEGN
ncbi:MAG: peptidase [Meiothermus sp.]